MSKAEERGGTYAIHKASEKLHNYYGNAMLGVVQFDGYDIKNAYIDGYHKAEKDLELGWEDIRDIYDLAYNLRFPHKKQKDFFEEVLKRFIEMKGNTDGE